MWQTIIAASYVAWLLSPGCTISAVDGGLIAHNFKKINRSQQFHHQP
jgi:hypothetical protein